MKSLFVSFPFSNGLGTSLLLSRVRNLAMLVIDKRDSSTPNKDC